MATKSLDVERVSDFALELVTRKPVMLVPWYLMASYAYYVEDDPIITDSAYDAICWALASALDAVEIEHPHMGLCEMEALDAGTGHNIKKKQYPSMVANSVEMIRGGSIPGTMV